MSELPDNWAEIKNDKAFWDEVKRMIAAGEIAEAKLYRKAMKHFALEDYDYELHELSIIAVLASKVVFTVYYEDYYGKETSSSVNELAGRFYVADWADPKMVIGPNDTIEDAASVILSCYDDGTFTDATSDLPIEQMLKLCEQAVPVGGEFGVNGVKYVMTKDGLVPV